MIMIVMIEKEDKWYILTVIGNIAKIILINCYSTYVIYSEISIFEKKIKLPLHYGKKCQQNSIQESDMWKSNKVTNEEEVSIILNFPQCLLKYDR